MLFSQHQEKDKRSQMLTVFRYCCHNNAILLSIHLNFVLFTYSNDTVDDLVNAICNLLGRRREELKIIRGGKELASSNRRVSSVASTGPSLSTRLANMKLMQDEAVQVVLRPVNSSVASNTENNETFGPVNHKSKVMRTNSPTSNDDFTDERKQEQEQCKVTEKSDKVYDSDFESYPAVVLSRNHNYMCALFRLLNNARSEQICDDIWQLISRIPTSPHIISKWCLNPDFQSWHVDFDDVLYTLTSPMQSQSYCEGTVRSVSLLLYNLQVVDSIIQPAGIPAGANDSQQSGVLNDVGISDTLKLSDEERNEWACVFLSSGGFRALITAFHDLVVRLKKKGLAWTGDEWCQAGSEPDILHEGGSSAKLLLSSLRLVVKLIRAVTVRTAVVLPVPCNDKPPISKFIDVLRSSSGLFSLSTFDEITQNPEEKRNQIDIEPKHEHCVRPPYKRAKLRSFEEGDLQYCHHFLPPCEWGSGLDEFFYGMGGALENDSNRSRVLSMSKREFVESISLTNLQMSFSDLLCSIRNFSLSSLFFYKQSDDESASQSILGNAKVDLSEWMMQVEDCQTALMEIANSVLLSWGSILTVKPNLLHDLMALPNPAGESEMTDESTLDSIITNLLTGRVLRSIVLNVDIQLCCDDKDDSDSPSTPNNKKDIFANNSNIYGFSGNSSQSMKRSYLSAVLGQWGSQALGALVRLEHYLDEISADGDDLSDKVYYQNAAIKSILRVRERLCETVWKNDQLNNNGEQSSYLSTKPLTTLCVNLLKSQNTKSNSISLMSYSELVGKCKVLFEDLQNISHSDHIHAQHVQLGNEELKEVRKLITVMSGKCFGSSSHINHSYIGETLQLLAAFLSACVDQVNNDESGDCELIEKRRICEFILRECLGVVHCDEVSLSTLCRHEEAKENSPDNVLNTRECQMSYDILGHFSGCAENCERSGNFNDMLWLYNHIVMSHASLDKTVADLDWGFKPHRDKRSDYVGLRNFGATCYMNSLMQVYLSHHQVTSNYYCYASRFFS